MDNLAKLFKNDKHIGYVVCKFFNDDFQSWDMRIIDLKGREYSIDANRVSERINLTNIEKDRLYYNLD